MTARPSSGGSPAVRRRASRLTAAALAACVATLTSTSAAKPGGIFDDDSDPPAATTRPTSPASAREPAVPPSPPPTSPPVTPVTPKPVATEPASPEPAPPKPVTPAPPTPALSKPPAPPPAVAKVARRNVPPAADLARSRAVLKEAFADQLADPSAAARGRLAGVLLDAAAKAARDPADQYALFGGAINAAKEAASLRQVSLAARATAAVFEVEPEAIVTGAAVAMSLKADTPTRTIDNVLVALDALDDRVAAGDLDAADRLAAAARAPAAADKALAALVAKRAADVAALRQARDRAAPAVAKLKTAPDDPAANSAAGAYDCFALGNWAAGLPLLAKGSDPGLKQAAAAELAGPADAAGWVALGDKWWALADRQPAAAAAAVRRHAVDCYAGAKGDLSPLQQIKVDKRAAEASPKAAGPSLSDFRLRVAVQRLTEFRQTAWAKVGLKRTPMPTADPIRGDVAWPAVAGGAYTVDGELMVGWNDGNHGKRFPSTKGTVRAAAGVVLDGGTVAVTNGLLDLQGEPDKPIYVRNVKFVVELGGTLKARHAVFENCSFAKGGAWWAVYSAKFDLADCLLMQCKFAGLNIVDYGLRVVRCTFVDAKFGDRQNKPGKTSDSGGNARAEWSRVADDDLYNCEFSASAAWMLQRCNLYGCRVLADPATFQSPADLSVELGLSRDDREKVLGDLNARTTSAAAGRVVYSVAPTFHPNQAFPPP
jgi:hypothetical protein